ncbi:MAG: DNA mismatch endonuclease Vsr [Blastocatellia bacterium]
MSTRGAPAGAGGKGGITNQKPGGRDVSAIMRSVKASDTGPEKKLRAALFARGLRYRVCPANLPGKPDVVLPAKRLIIFIDGDYWHGGQWRLRNLASLEEQFGQTKVRDYWLQKIRRTMQRDCRHTVALLADGWTVLRFWESEIQADVEQCVDLVLRTLADKPAPAAAALAPQKNVAEFFAGIGLMRMGLETEGWSVSFANDIDPQKEAMYRAQFADAAEHFHAGDIHHLEANALPAVTLATASFPCTDLSLAGGRRGLQGKHSGAFWGFVNALDAWGARRPPLVLLENVTGFLTSHGGADFREALLALNRLGYEVDAFVIDAARFVPQSRQRLFVAGVQAGLTTACADVPPVSDLRPAALIRFMAAHPEIRWNARPLPDPGQTKAGLAELVEELPDDAPEWWEAGRAAYLLGQMSARHRAVANEMIAGDAWRYGTVFRRVRNGVSMAELRTDGIAGCLRTPRGGSGRQILFKAGHGKYFVRLLTPRECARLMGADTYRIETTANKALFGFGDAVCVPVIEWIARYYLNPVVNEALRGRPLRMTQE